MKANEMLLKFIDILDNVYLHTNQEDIKTYQFIDNPWHLTKDGVTKCFVNQQEISDYLGISKVNLGRAYRGYSRWLTINGYKLAKLVLVGGKVRFKK